MEVTQYSAYCRECHYFGEVHDTAIFSEQYAIEDMQNHNVVHHPVIPVKKVFGYGGK